MSELKQLYQKKIGYSAHSSLKWHSTFDMAQHHFLWAVCAPNASPKHYGKFNWILPFVSQVAVPLDSMVTPYLPLAPLSRQCALCDQTAVGTRNTSIKSSKNCRRRRLFIGNNSLVVSWFSALTIVMCIILYLYYCSQPLWNSNLNMVPSETWLWDSYYPNQKKKTERLSKKYV